MDRHDFISRIISMYPHMIKDEGISTYYDLYKRNLYGKDVDYDKLFDLFATEYKSKYPPEGAEIGSMALRCLKTEIKPAEKWIHVKIYNPIKKAVINSDCFPAGTSEQAILNTYKKRFGGEGWQLVEVYNV